MVPVIRTLTLTAGVANAVALTQTPGAAGNLTINGASAAGGVATLAAPRRIIITSAGNNVGRTFTIYGTNASGNPITDTVAGTSGSAAQSNLDFLTVTRVAIDGASTGALTVGTNTVGSMPWVMPNYHLTPFILQIEGAVTGTAGWSLEYTLDDFVTAGAPPPLVRATSVVNAAGNVGFTFTFPIRGWRATVLSGVGTVIVEAMQAGIN